MRHTQEKIEQVIKLLESFDYNKEGDFFYWINAIGAMFNLTARDKGQIIVYFNECRRKEKRQ